MENLLAAWKDVTPRFREAAHILMFFDFDGTLAPIVERPELAVMPATTAELLASLARRRDFTLGVVSGRALSDLKKRVRLNNIIYAGNHGLEIEGPGIRLINPIADELRPVLRILHQVLSHALAGIEGVIIEDKGLTVSVHYRLVPDSEVGRVKNVFDRAVTSALALGRIEVTSGKKVYEIRPAAGWDKGKAIDLLIWRQTKSSQHDGVLPVYAGDDATDEDGFKAVMEHHKGITIFVGDRSTRSAASHYLESPVQVARFLKLVNEEARRGFR